MYCILTALRCCDGDGIAVGSISSIIVSKHFDVIPGKLYKPVYVPLCSSGVGYLFDDERNPNHSRQTIRYLETPQRTIMAFRGRNLKDITDFIQMKNDLRSSEGNLCGKKPAKIQDFNEVWTRDFAMPVRCSNQLSYEANGAGSRSSCGSIIMFPWNRRVWMMYMK